ncbi:MAG: ABC transporter permease [Candidatus Euphemobacter frigidus]|nr:ABC transporter permease [Candidatus Euphemobacter frigidus]
MKAYFIRRLFYLVPIIVGISLITFLLFRVVGGDPVDRVAGRYATSAQKAELRHQFGFDKPLWPPVGKLLKGDLKGFADNQLFRHFADTFTFRFGRSEQYKRKISDMIKDGVLPSLSLTVPAFIIGIFLQITIAVFCAFKQGSRFDRVVVVLSVIGMSLPYLALIIFGQAYLAGKLKWFPIYGYPEGIGLGVIPFVALPVLLGVVAGLGAGVRFYRTVILDETRADYVRTARAKGVGETGVMFGHVLKNAMIPIITQVVVVIPFLFLGSLLLERFFSIPGLGYMLIDAVNSSDWPVINALTFVGALIYLGALLLTDLCYALVDPRVTLK